MEPSDGASWASGNSDFSDFDLLNDCAFDVLSWSTSGESLDGDNRDEVDPHDSGECWSGHDVPLHKVETLISLRVPSPAPSARGSSSPTPSFTPPPHPRISPTPRAHPVPETPSTDSENFESYHEPPFYPHNSWQVGKLRWGLPSDKSRKEGHGRCGMCSFNSKFKAARKRKGLVREWRTEIRLVTEWEPHAERQWTGPGSRRRY
ncbi:hypothetical protein M427DRAFT_420863 [Gonapodya prolifera JEL478]|uniref:Uncharacterized protein n=1 Tax=Gonapodya prolifera (strain JEL478) TaxID=1344416 RepID=A0A139A4G0_GONPJ|nr:hypothetical protein M427DRAFT_420863 [Gonapodya prolifera JEL478]|eukprot:KXS11682.1 hypothetical protein M427DRAFT_420863 [Gonapodya prolifera JEL478]